MLVLTRKRNESIVVGEDIVIQVTQIQGNRVSLAIQAPREVSIMRAELLAAIEMRCPDTAPETHGSLTGAASREGESKKPLDPVPATAGGPPSTGFDRFPETQNSTETRPRYRRPR